MRCLCVLTLPPCVAAREKHIFQGLEGDLPFQSLEKLIYTQFKLQPNSVLFYTGFPPQQLRKSITDSSTLEQLNIKNGDSIELREISAEGMEEAAEMKQGSGGWKVISMIDNKGYFQKRAMPGDNSSVPSSYNGSAMLGCIGGSFERGRVSVCLSFL